MLKAAILKKLSILPTVVNTTTSANKHAEEKNCPKCARMLSRNKDFHKDKHRYDGVQSICKDCCAKRLKAYRKTKAGKLSHRKFEHKYNRTKAGKAVHKKAVNRLKARYPMAYRAHNIVTNALREGKLQKQPCVVCKTVKKIKAHHEDYWKPLEIIWLCDKHHKRLHRQYKKIGRNIHKESGN